MTKQITQTTNDTGSAVGWLTWWTIHAKELDAHEVRQAARDAQLPGWMIDRISGRTPRSAWLSATQLGAKGTPSATAPSDPTDSRARYLTRNLNEESRVVIREVINPANERVSVANVGIVYLMGTRIDFARSDDYFIADQPVQREVDVLFDQMRQDFQAMVGKVDDGRIRALVLDWLERHYRVCVRGTGGVYLIPRPDDTFWQEATEEELVAVSQWVTAAPIDGLFSIVELHQSGATTMDVFRASAIDEMKSALEEVNSKLVDWRDNQRMNAGSRMFSASEMGNRLDALEEKLGMLTSSLGEEMAVIKLMLSRVRKEADTMRIEAATQVAAAKEQRRAQAAAEKEARERHACPGCGRSFETARGLARHTPACKGKDEPKKRGTARQRAKKQQL